MKHKIKRFVREAWARGLYHTGLLALTDRLAPRRLTILAGHCVTAPSNASLPKDMKIEGEKLRALLEVLARRCDLVTVGEGVRALATGSGRSQVALSMDDGYADNRTHLLPLLESLGARATVYVETRPLDERRVNWTHKLFACFDAIGGPESFVLRFTEIARDKAGNILLAQLVPHGSADAYHVKRVLKYEFDPAERDRAIDVLCAELGVDERAICDELYMTWDDVRALDASGRVEIGGHTVSHAILSKLAGDAQRAEVAGSRESIAKGLGKRAESFAYPFGRRWDWNDGAAIAARDAGFASATTTHAGTNLAEADRFRLKRIMIDEDVEPHLVACEAFGGFELLRRFGLDLSE